MAIKSKYKYTDLRVLNTEVHKRDYTVSKDPLTKTDISCICWN